MSSYEEEERIRREQESDREREREAKLWEQKQKEEEERTICNLLCRESVPNTTTTCSTYTLEISASLQYSAQPSSATNSGRFAGYFDDKYASQGAPAALFSS